LDEIRLDGGWVDFILSGFTIKTKTAAIAAVYSENFWD